MPVFSTHSFKKHEANQKTFTVRDGEGQHDFSVKSTRLTPEIVSGHAKEELNLGKSLW